MTRQEAPERHLWGAPHFYSPNTTAKTHVIFLSHSNQLSGLIKFTSLAVSSTSPCSSKTNKPLVVSLRVKIMDNSLALQSEVVIVLATRLSLNLPESA